MRLILRVFLRGAIPPPHSRGAYPSPSDAQVMDTVPSTGGTDATGAAGGSTEVDAVATASVGGLRATSADDELAFGASATQLSHMCCVARRSGGGMGA